MIGFIKRLLIGKPLNNAEAAQERMSNWKALAIFSSDALSSVAYGPEQIMLVLAIPGLIVYGFISNIALAILILLAIVTFSYTQITKANPGGGGSYAVAMHNLGEIPALVTAAALLADYTLTVAVSVSAGTAAITSAFPDLAPYAVGIDLLVLFGILTLVNLRGLREASTFFVIPTYAFIFGIFALIGTGIFQALTQTAPVIPQASLEKHFEWGMMLVLLRAFANGCSSMTGIEAISNGVRAFKPPEVHNATKTTFVMAILLGSMFSGIAFLLLHLHILPVGGLTALSQIAASVFGNSVFYYYIQITTMLILYLAANTAFNGLPPLLSLLAHDGYMPRYLAFRGDRLSYSNGILFLSIASGLLIYMFDGDTEHLIALYAIGVFLSFTIAQTGMVVHWFKEHSSYWQFRALINGIGALVTSIVVLIIGVSKFFYGAWAVIIFIPCMVYIFHKIKHHYNDMAEQLRISSATLPPVTTNPADLRENIVIVPIASPTTVVGHTLEYAKSISKHIMAVNVAIDEEGARRVKEKWDNWHTGVELKILPSPYRLINQPLIDYIAELAKEKGDQYYITVLIPEFETKKLWHRLLHNQTGLLLSLRLILSENVIVATVPFHLQK